MTITSLSVIGVNFRPRLELVQPRPKYPYMPKFSPGGLLVSSYSSVHIMKTFGFVKLTSHRSGLRSIPSYCSRLMIIAGLTQYATNRTQLLIYSITVTVIRRPVLISVCHF